MGARGGPLLASGVAHGDGVLSMPIDVLDDGLHDRLVLLHGLLLVVHAVEDVGHEVGGE